MIRFRFRLRTLLLLVAAASVPCFVVGTWLRDRELENNAIERWKAAGATVIVDAFPPGWLPVSRSSNFWDRIIALENPAPRLTDDDLAGVHRLKHLTRLDLTGTQISDCGLSHLRGTAISSLSLERTSISDEGLRSLERLQLSSLNLNATAIKGPGLAAFTNMPIERLDAEPSQLEDEGLRQIGKLTQLRLLFVSSPNITDGGLRYLSRLTNLERLSIEGKKLTDDGIVRIAQDLTALQDLIVGGGAVTDDCNRRLRAIRPMLNVTVTHSSAEKVQPIRE